MHRAPLLALLTLLPLTQSETFDEDEAVQAAKQAIHSEFGIGESQLESYQVLAAQWSDSSLGCRRNGRAYQPVMTRGYRVFLRKVGAPANLYEVHVTSTEAVVCETVDPDVKRTLPKSDADQTAKELRSAPRLARLAREDLAARLGVEPTDIVVTLTPRIWPDTSLGCPKEGVSYDSANIEGFVIVLEIDDVSYTYHADTESVFLCEEVAEP